MKTRYKRHTLGGCFSVNSQYQQNEKPNIEPQFLHKPPLPIVRDNREETLDVSVACVIIQRGI